MVFVVVAIIGAAINGGGVVIVLSLIVAVAAFAAIAYGAREYRTWHDLEFVVPEWPLSLGTEISAELVQQAKVAVPDRQFPITGLVVCHEKVRYQVGTDTRTEKRIASSTPFTADGAVLGGVFRAIVPLRIPLDEGGPTIDLEHNEITWRVELDLEELSRLSSSQSFELEVAPHLHGQSGRIQDSPRPPA